MASKLGIVAFFFTILPHAYAHDKDDNCPAAVQADVVINLRNGGVRKVHLRAPAFSDRLSQDRSDYSELVDQMAPVGVKTNIPFEQLPARLQTLITDSDLQTITLMTGNWFGYMARDFVVNTDPVTAVVRQNFETHGFLFVRGNGVMQGDLDLTPVTNLSSRLHLPTDGPPLSELQKAVKAYCDSTPHSRSVFRGLIDENFEEVEGFRHGPRGIDSKVLVACGDLTVDSIMESTVLADGNIDIWGGGITNNSRVVATKEIRARHSHASKIASYYNDQRREFNIKDASILPRVTPLDRDIEISDSRPNEWVCVSSPGDSDEFVNQPMFQLGN